MDKIIYLIHVDIIHPAWPALHLSCPAPVKPCSVLPIRRLPGLGVIWVMWYCATTWSFISDEPCPALPFPVWAGKLSWLQIRLMFYTVPAPHDRSCLACHLPTHCLSSQTCVSLPRSPRSAPRLARLRWQHALHVLGSRTRKFLVLSGGLNQKRDPSTMVKKVRGRQKGGMLTFHCTHILAEGPKWGQNREWGKGAGKRGDALKGTPQTHVCGAIIKQAYANRSIQLKAHAGQCVNRLSVP